MDNTAKASHPANMPFSFVQYLRCYPAMLLLPGAMFLFIAVIGFLKHFSTELCAVMGAFMAVAAIPMAAANIKRQMREGNLCAAIVVSTAPYTVAVLTDLCNDGSGPKLAVKIKTAPLEKIAGGAPKLRAKLPAASHYFGSTGTGSWKSFNPMIIQCACTDQAQIKRALDSIDPRDWQVLEQAMKSLKPTALGLHHLQM